MLARLMPSLPIVIFCHFRCDQLLFPGKGIPGGNPNCSSRADPYFIGIRSTSPARPPTCSRFSGSSLAPHDRAYNIRLQLASREEVHFLVTLISKELNGDQLCILMNSQTNLMGGNLTL
jgi:hypothetical protein